MAEIVLRAAVAEDAPLLLSLIHQSFEAYREILNPPSGAHRETLDTIRQKLSEGGGYIAWIEDHAAGGVVYEPHETVLYLGRLAVLPAYRKQGIGRLLVEAVEGKARHLHLPKVTLGVRVQLTGNRIFFERLGYQVVGVDSHDGYSQPTFMTLEKTLG